MKNFDCILAGAGAALLVQIIFGIGINGMIGLVVGAIIAVYLSETILKSEAIKIGVASGIIAGLAGSVILMPYAEAFIIGESNLPLAFSLSAVYGIITGIIMGIIGSLIGWTAVLVKKLMAKDN